MRLFQVLFTCGFAGPFRGPKGRRSHGLRFEAEDGFNKTKIVLV